MILIDWLLFFFLVCTVLLIYYKIAVWIIRSIIRIIVWFWRESKKVWRENPPTIDGQPLSWKAYKKKHFTKQKMVLYLKQVIAWFFLLYVLDYMISRQ